MATTTLNKPVTAGKAGTRPVIFIDGEAGTTGIEIRDRLAKVSAVEMRSIDPEKRKEPAARKAMMADADLVVLCLPDDAAKEAVALAAELGSKAPRILDASSAHRVADGWTFGWPEMAPGQADAIAKAAKVSNPGCYPTGGIALIRPLVDAGLMPADYPVTVNADWQLAKIASEKIGFANWEAIETVGGFGEIEKLPIEIELNHARRAAR